MTTEAEAHALRTFSRLVATHERGDLDNELSNAMSEVVIELEQHYQAYRGKPKAKLVVEFNFTKDKNGITVTAGMSSKLPIAPRTAVPYFVTEKNELTGRDPRQYDMQLRDVGGADTPKVRDIS